MSVEKQTEHLGLRVPSELKKRLAEIAETEHRSVSQQVSIFLSQCVERWKALQDEVEPS
jgi:hypothetical protein